MSSNHQKKYSFSAISIKPKVATRFRKFSKEITHSHTDTLEAMMNFFDLNELSPNESLGANMKTLENSLKKRINALVAIIRDIEKNQTLPTIGMIQALFNQELDNEEEGDDFLEDMIEKNPPKPYPKFEGEVMVPRIKYEHLEEKAASLQTDLKDILGKVKVVKGSFGKSYLKLEITEGRLERYKLEVNRSLDSLY